jgi:hypothetical protein
MSAAGRPQQGGVVVSAGKIVLLVFGIIVIVIAIGLVIAGSGALWANAALTDDEGYYTTKSLRLDKDSYAIVTQPAEVDLGAAWAWDWSRLVSFKVEGRNTDPAKGIFIGVAEEQDVLSYLRDVEYDEIIDFQIDPDEFSYWNHPGSGVPAPPTAETFWSESAHGAGTQKLEWTLKSGTWSLVLMNEDGSQAVDLRGVVGVKIPWVFGLGLGLLIGGIVALVLGAVMVFLAVRRA